MSHLFFARPYRLNPQTRRVVEIMQRDGSITRLKAMHYGIAGITQEVSRIRAAAPIGHSVVAERRKDYNGKPYTAWVITKKEAN